RAASGGHADAVLVLTSPVLNSQRTQTVNLAARSRLPSVYFATEFVDDGGLMAYGVNFPDLFRRAATYVDKILKGAKPADLPIERATKFETIVNLKTAKTLGIDTPTSLLLRANEVIE